MGFAEGLEFLHFDHFPDFFVFSASIAIIISGCMLVEKLERRNLVAVRATSA
ncbi:hypothetical protein MACH01_13620 [Thalassospira tepidiphila]|nr:hypothetical protein MACH01_13620 [Thalassospira tepidiphila]